MLKLLIFASPFFISQRVWDIILVPRTFICTVPFDRPPLPVLLFSFFLNGDLLFTVLTFVDEQETKSLHVKHKSCFTLSLKNAN